MSIEAASGIIPAHYAAVGECRLMISDTVLGCDLTSDKPVSLSFRSRTKGLYCLGKQGAGKSNFLLNLIIQDMFHGIGLCVLDPHGDLIVDILGCVPPHRENDVFLLDIQDTEHPFAFDLFAGVDATNVESLKSGEERIVGIFKKVWGETWGPRLEYILGNSVHVLLHNPGTTLAQLPPLLTDPTYREQLLRRVSTPVVRDYFTHEYNPLTLKAQAAIYGPLMNKVGKFLRDPVLGPIISQPGATVDFSTIMAKRQILLIRLNADWAEATSLLGTAMVLMLFQAALQRKKLPMHQRAPFAVYADEFQLFATPTFGHLFQQARKYRVATTIAHQIRSQLSGDLQDAVKGAVNIVTFQTMTDDAGEMAREYRSRGSQPLPYDLFRWAERHSDPAIRSAVAAIKFHAMTIEIRYAEEGSALSYPGRLRFIEDRLKQAVREGNARATPFPPQFWYNTYDPSAGFYGMITEEFAVLRDRLLATKHIDASELADLPIGQAAAKVEQSDGSMRQCLLRFPIATTEEHSAVAKRIFDEERPLREPWPPEIDPRYIQAGLRAKRIRERNRQRYDRPEIPAPVAAASAPSPRPGSAATRPQFEVDLP